MTTAVLRKNLFKPRGAFADNLLAPLARPVAMIDINSNCSRVDAVKAIADQLKMQLAQAPQSVPENENYRKAQDQIQALDQEITNGDAQKAETALSTATTAVKELQTQGTSNPEFRPGFNAYA